MVSVKKAYRTRKQARYYKRKYEKQFKTQFQVYKKWNYYYLNTKYNVHFLDEFLKIKNMVRYNRFVLYCTKGKKCNYK